MTKTSHATFQTKKLGNFQVSQTETQEGVHCSICYFFVIEGEHGYFGFNFKQWGMDMNSITEDQCMAVCNYLVNSDADDNTVIESFSEILSRTLKDQQEN